MVFVVAIIRELRGRVWRALGLSLTRRLETCLQVVHRRRFRGLGLARLRKRSARGSVVDAGVVFVARRGDGLVLHGFERRGLDARLALRELGERGLKLDLRSLEIGDGLGQDVELLGAHGVESTHGGLSLRELALEEFDALRHGG